MKNWEETNAVSLEQAQRKITRDFPELKITKIEHAGTGFDTTVYQVNNQFVFRFPRQEKGRNAMENENKILRELYKNNFQSPYLLPEPLFYSQGEEGEYPFVGFSYISGHELAKEKDVDLLQNEAGRLGLFLKRLHAVPGKEMLPEDVLKRLSSRKRKPMLKEMLPELQEVCEPHIMEMLQSYLREIPDWENPESTHFVHGDLHPKNMIAQKGKLTGVIDWGDAHFGHPASDLAVVYQSIPEEHHPRFFAEYGNIDEETRKLAIFKSVFISAAVGRAAYFKNDKHAVKWCHAGLKRALQTWYK